jgi:hypothetical protein
VLRSASPAGDARASAKKTGAHRRSRRNRCEIRKRSVRSVRPRSRGLVVFVGGVRLGFNIEVVRAEILKAIPVLSGLRRPPILIVAVRREVVGRLGHGQSPPSCQWRFSAPIDLVYPAGPAQNGCGKGTPE